MGILLQRYERMRFSIVQYDRKLGIEQDESCRRDLCGSVCGFFRERARRTEGEKVRPHWEDGTSAYTIKKFGVVNRYDLSKEFPAITLRKTAIKTCTEEMLWIWQRKSNNIHDLNSTVWDEWADEDGSIGKASGYHSAAAL